MDPIQCDIVDKPGITQGTWRITGITPDGITDLNGRPTSGGIHVYGGNNASVVDSETDMVIATGGSLRNVLQALANRTGRIVTLEDECGSYNLRLTPRR